MSRRESFGGYTAIEGKLDPGDSRAAYVTAAGSPVASFWSFEDACRYAAKRAKPLTAGTRVRAVLPKDRPMNPYELARYAYGTLRECFSHEGIVIWDEPCGLPARVSLGVLSRFDADLDPRKETP